MNILSHLANVCASAAGKGSSNNLIILRVPPHPHPVSCMRFVILLVIEARIQQ
jgi:hypothetical protein